MPRLCCLLAVMAVVAPARAQAPVEPAAPEPPAEAPKVTYPTVTVGGVLQLDTGWFRQSALNRALVGDADAGSAFRTARLWAKGSLLAGTNYMFELDFGSLASLTPGRPNFQNAYLEVEDLPLLGTVRAGRWKQPFSLETMTSIRFLTFIERANTFAFVPFRRTGLGFFNATDDERWTYAASVFRAGDDGYGGFANDGGGWATAARVTHLLWDRDCGADLLHLGLAHTWNDAPNDRVRFGRFPEFAINVTPTGTSARGTPNFFDTGALPAHDYHVLGSEAAWVHGPFTMQAEGMLAVVNRSGAARAVFPSWYVFAGWFLTGEQRAYLRKAGAFDRVTPLRNFATSKSRGIEGPGAWELAVRLSQADVNDGGIDGGRLTDLTVGLNWHLNPNAKLQFNYIRAWRDAPGDDDSAADIFGLRASIDF